MRENPFLRSAPCLLILTALVGCGDGDTDGQGASGGNDGDDDGTGGEVSDGGGSQGGGGDGGAGAGGGSTFQGMSRVDDGNGTAVMGSSDVAIAPDGTIYVAWVDARSGNEDVFVASSSDGGVTFGAAVQLDDETIDPLVSMARHPYVAASDDRVSVVFNDEAGQIFLYVSDAGALSFGAPTMIGGDVDTEFRDFPKALFLDDGSLAVAFHGYPASGARIFVSRESDAFASEAATSGAPGVPCECCPIDLVQSDAGNLFLAFRNNDFNVREMWVAEAPGAGAFSAWEQVSTSEGIVDACPMQGPRVGYTSPDSAVAVWSVRGQESTGQVFLATSADGTTWSGGSGIGFVGDEPTVAVANGNLYVTGVTGSGRSALVTSTDGGSTWSEAENLASPDGSALAVPQAEGAFGFAALAAVNSEGVVWLRRME